MLPGDTYPNVLAKLGSGFGPLVVPPADQIGGQGAGAAIKKYCIGIVNGANTGPADNWAMMDNNTYIMRYADLLLIHAEAILAGGGSSSDASALSSLNAVRNRAGLPSVSSFTFNDLFLERRKELAFEGHRYSDLQRYGLVGNLFPSNEQFRVLWPIPLQEIEVNSSLEQNPGY